MARGKGGGRPRWQPKNLEHTRVLVEALAGFGHTHETIAAVLDPPCSPNTLAQYFAAELASAAMIFKARVEGTLARYAIGVPEVRAGRKVIQKAVPPDKTLLIFLLKARYGYRDSQRHELTGLEGLNISSLTDAQLAQLIERISGLVTARAEGGAGEADGSQVGKVH